MIRYAGLLLALAAPLSALDPATLKPQGYLSDFAGVVDAESRTKLERYLEEVKQSTGVEIAFVTVATLEGEPVEDFTNKLFRQWGVGAKGTNEGIMLLLAIQDRRSRLEVGYGLEPYIPDGFAGSLLRAMRPALAEGHYGDGFILAAQRINDRVREGKKLPADQAKPPPPTSRPRRSTYHWIVDYWPIWLFIIIWLLNRMGGGRGGPFFIPFGMGGGFGGYHGSSGGGGGFGGFGGGDSGGGGSSSNW